jgi:hypothetical protein
MSYDPRTGQWINDGYGQPPPQSYGNQYQPNGPTGNGPVDAYGRPLPPQGYNYSFSPSPGYNGPQFQNAQPGVNAPQPSAVNTGNDAMYAPGYGPGGPIPGYNTGYAPNGSKLASSGAPTYDPKNPDPYINYYYKQTHGVDAPPDQLQYWRGKFASTEATGTGAPADPAYWTMRLTNPNYDTGPGTGGANGMGYGGGYGMYGAPLFTATDPLQAYQRFDPGSFNYQPMNAPGPFQLPTGQQALDQDPGYQFRLQQGIDALQNSAASRGGLKDPNTARAIQDYGQQSASQEYGNAYNRALQTYQTNTGTDLAANQQNYQQGLGAFQTNAQIGLQANNQNFQNQLAQYQTNFADPLAAYQANVNSQLGFGNLGVAQGGLGVSQGYLGLATDNQAFQQPYQLAQLGLGATQGAANTGLGYFNGLTNLYGSNAGAQGALITGQGNANAAGQVASGNAWQNGLANIGNNANAWAAYAAANRRPPTPAPPPSTGGW